MSRYTYFLADGSLAADSDISWPGGGGPSYEVLHPKTGLPVPVPEAGWRLTTAQRMREAIAAGQVIFRDDHTKPIRLKKRLTDVLGQVAMSVFERQRTHGGRRLKELFDGNSPFDFPKDTDVLGRWIDLVTQSNTDATVLDFFAGSGSAGHAVMNLNVADGGNRRFILVQLDEAITTRGYNTIADITRERLQRAGKQIHELLDSDQPDTDTGFRSYRLAESNVKPWDGTSELDLLAAVDNLADGRTSDDLLVEMMLRLGIDLVTPVLTREVAGSTLYSLSGTLYAFFGTDVTIETADEIAKTIVAWKNEDPVDSDVTAVVRDTGFNDSSAKLNLAAALQQAGIKTLRSI